VPSSGVEPSGPTVSPTRASCRAPSVAQEAEVSRLCYERPIFGEFFFTFAREQSSYVIGGGAKARETRNSETVGPIETRFAGPCRESRGDFTGEAAIFSDEF
jgi:hypothetical protein